LKVKINNNKTMRPYILAESNWKAIKETKIEMAILPWGATEAHNYHLPYATDNIESDLLAAESAKLAWEKGAKVIVLPTIPFGVNTGQSDIYLDINMNPSTQFAILNDIIEVLNRQGIYKLMIFNSHGGNNWKSIIRELGLKYPKMFIFVTNWFQSLDKNKYFDEPGDHADEMETSLLLYLKPELVLPKEDWGDGKEKKNKIEAFSEGWVWTERKWSQISEDTGVGNPKAATKEKGEKFFKDVTLKMSKLIEDVCREDINNLYC
jgi:creatinine amidohydrolase